MITLNRRGVLAAAAMVPALALGTPAFAQGGEVTITHYFTGEFGLKVFNEQVAKFEAATGHTLKNSPVGHEDFKTDILVRAAGDSLPDVFSYWAGARTQFVVDSGSLHAIDEMWNRDGLDDVVAKSVAGSATLYNGKRYLVPFNYHYAGHVLQHEGVGGRGRHRHAGHVGGVPGPVRDAQGQGRDADRARVEAPLAGAVLVRLPAAAHRRTRLPREPHERLRRVRRRRGQGRHGDVEGSRGQGLLRSERECRHLDRCVGQGGPRRCGDDPDGHLDHRLLERSGAGARYRLRLLPLPGRSPTACPGRWWDRSTGW